MPIPNYWVRNGRAGRARSQRCVCYLTDEGECGTIELAADFGTKAKLIDCYYLAGEMKFG
jgi:hypothetical protein